MSRLVLRISLGMLFVLVASFFIVKWGITQTEAHSRVHKRMQSQLARVDLARDRLDGARPDQLDAELKRVQQDLGPDIRLLDPKRAKLPEIVRQAWLVREPTVTLRRHHGATVWMPIRPHNRLLAVGPGEPIRWVEHAPVKTVVLALFGVILLTGVLLSWPIVSRLGRLERTALAIGAGDLDARAKIGSRDAVGRVAEGFNEMADRVQGLLESQQRLLQAVAHELRTPAARIRFGLEMLGDEDDPAARRKRLQSIDEDLDELDLLLEELSVYIRVGRQVQAQALEPVVAEKELGDLLAKLADLNPDMETEVVLESPEAATLHTDPRAFRRAMRNLLANALRHGRTRVEVRVGRREDEVRIAVCDDGPGVPEDERERVFEPFYRLDASRNRESGGSGLGLAIVRRIVKALDGAVWVEEADGGGACFVSTWPAASRDTKRYEPVPNGD